MTAQTSPPEVARRDNGPHLHAVDLYRVVTFTCVVAQHAVLFTAPTTNPASAGVVFLLHFTREAFFMLTGFVLVHSYLSRPLSPTELWRRRIPLVAVPYLTWTLIYVGILAVQRHASFVGAIELLGHYGASGYYHLYFLVVTVQIYLLFPLLVRLLRRTQGHHVALVLLSAAVQLGIEVALHETDRPPASGTAHAIASVILPSKSVFTYEFFIVAGALAGWHRSCFERTISQYGKRIAGGVIAIAVISLAWYGLNVASGQPAMYAADVFQPVTVIWSLAAAVGMYALGLRFAPTRAVRWASDASFGIYLVHVLVLHIVITLLAHLHVVDSWPWPAKTLLVLLISLPAATGFVELARRTPLSRPLTGRLRRPDLRQNP